MILCDTGPLVAAFNEADRAARIPVPKLSVPSPTRDASGTIAAMALYAGQSVGAVTEIAAAGAVVRELADGAEQLLHAISH